MVSRLNSGSSSCGLGHHLHVWRKAHMHTVPQPRCRRMWNRTCALAEDHS